MPRNKYSDAQRNAVVDRYFVLRSEGLTAAAARRQASQEHGVNPASIRHWVDYGTSAPDLDSFDAPPNAALVMALRGKVATLEGEIRTLRQANTRARQALHLLTHTPQPVPGTPAAFTTSPVSENDRTLIRDLWTESYCACGVTKIFHMARTRGYRISRRMVARIMAEEGLSPVRAPTTRGRMVPLVRLHSWTTNPLAWMTATQVGRSLAVDVMVWDAPLSPVTVLFATDIVTREILAWTTQPVTMDVEVLPLLHDALDTILEMCGPRAADRCAAMLVVDQSAQNLTVTDSPHPEQGLRTMIRTTAVSFRSEITCLLEHTSEWTNSPSSTVNSWVTWYNNIRPHSAIRYKTPVQHRQQLLDNTSAP